MSKSTVRVLGFLSIGFGVIFYGIGYLTVRPILYDMGILHYIPPLGGLSTVVGLLLVLAATWTVFNRLYSALGIDKM